MKAAVLTRVGEVVMTADWPEPAPGRGEVVVELTGVGLCGSDLAVWSGGRAVDFPWIVGHEGTGTIVAAGEGVSGGPGRRPGGHRAELPLRRVRRLPARPDGHVRAPPVPGDQRPGAAQGARRDPRPVRVAAPAGLADQDLVCVEPMTVALHAARLGRAAAGSSCLIVGAGSQGLLLLLVLRAIGADVAVVEPHQGRLAIARSLGARAPRGTATSWSSRRPVPSAERSRRCALSAPAGRWCSSAYRTTTSRSPRPRSCGATPP